MCGFVASAWGVDPEGRPIAEIRVEGLRQVSEQLVRNQVRSIVGDPFDADTIEKDIVRITHLGVFDTVVSQIEPQDDGTVLLIFVVVEQAVLADVQVVGNKAVSDQELLALVVLRSGDPADTFLIERGKRQIRAAYEDAGYFMAAVDIDQAVLDEAGILIYRVVEGPKVRIKAFRFEGNNSFIRKQLKAHIRSKSYVPILRGGELSREQLELDASRIRDFYHDRGFLDAQVARRIDLSPNQRNAVVVFQIEEGRQYVVDQVRIEGNEQFPPAQIEMNLILQPGSVYSEKELAQSREAIRDLYGKLGYLETRVDIVRVFHPDLPLVDLVVQIDERKAYTVGSVTVRGNSVTRSKVILRQLRGLDPGTRFDRTGLDKTRRRLREGSVFSEGVVTILGTPEDEVRDVLIEVTEAQTGNVSFGAGISSDVGVVGAIQLTQRNFDISDFPENGKELATGRAFRGAGQTFNLSLQPGTDTSRFSVGFAEPYVFESDYFFNSSLFLFDREQEDFDEGRRGLVAGVGQRFGDVWKATVQGRFTTVDIDNIDPTAPVDVFAVMGDSTLTSLGFVVVRDGTNSFIFPTRGNKIEGGFERVGALGGDYDFTRVRGEFDQFWTVAEDIFERKTVVHFGIEVGMILENDEAPHFERFYAGGHRSFRGFSYRGIGPRGIRADTGKIGDDPVGGDFMLLTTLEYNFPVYEELLRGVVFTDMGTVQDDVGVDEWRVSIGTGVRVKMPFFGAAPIALDLSVPISKQEGDETQIISFDIALPLQ